MHCPEWHWKKKLRCATLNPNSVLRDARVWEYLRFGWVTDLMVWEWNLFGTIGSTLTGRTILVRHIRHWLAWPRHLILSYPIGTGKRLERRLVFGEKILYWVRELIFIVLRWADVISSIWGKTLIYLLLWLFPISVGYRRTVLLLVWNILFWTIRRSGVIR